jgi:hypothetical protein
VTVVIGEVVTEIVVGALTRGPDVAADARAGDDAAREEALVRRATERVLETLRREWE